MESLWRRGHDKYKTHGEHIKHQCLPIITRYKTARKLIQTMNEHASQSLAAPRKSLFNLKHRAYSIIEYFPINIHRQHLYYLHYMPLIMRNFKFSHSQPIYIQLIYSKNLITTIWSQNVSAEDYIFIWYQEPWLSVIELYIDLQHFSSLS